jgi:hypothetical protein
MAGRVGPATGLGQKRLPFRAGQALIVPIGAGVLAAMVEEADIVVGPLQRLDLGLNETVQLTQIGDQVSGQGEVHGRFLQGSFGPSGRSARLAR